MKRIHIIGRKNSGKTTLIVELVEYLTRQGLRVGTVKHTHHHHELDTPGKDSHRHRQAGAHVVGILSPRLSAVFRRSDGEHDGPDRYEVIDSLFADCQIVLVEGHSQSAAPRVEVWRAETGKAALAEEDRAILAVITDDTLDVDLPRLPRSDVPALAQKLLQWAR